MPVGVPPRSGSARRARRRPRRRRSCGRSARRRRPRSRRAPTDRHGPGHEPPTQAREGARHADAAHSKSAPRDHAGRQVGARQGRPHHPLLALGQAAREPRRRHLLRARLRADRLAGAESCRYATRKLKVQAQKATPQPPRRRPPGARADGDPDGHADRHADRDPRPAPAAGPRDGPDFDVLVFTGAAPAAATAAGVAALKAIADGRRLQGHAERRRVALHRRAAEGLPRRRAARRHRLAAERRAGGRVRGLLQGRRRPARGRLGDRVRAGVGVPDRAAGHARRRRGRAQRRTRRSRSPTAGTRPASRCPSTGRAATASTTSRTTSAGSRTCSPRSTRTPTPAAR